MSSSESAVTSVHGNQETVVVLSQVVKDAEQLATSVNTINQAFARIAKGLHELDAQRFTDREGKELSLEKEWRVLWMARRPVPRLLPWD